MIFLLVYLHHSLRISLQLSISGKLLKNEKIKNSIDYFKCKSCKHSYPQGASLYYPILMDWDFLM
jgi:hypothetical protein